MTLFSMGPTRVDLPTRIAEALQPLQGDTFTCSETGAMHVWRFLELYEHLGFDVFNLDPEHDIMERGEVYERKKEAAELTARAFRAVFGEADFKRVKHIALRVALCEAQGAHSPKPATPRELEQGKQFFKVWFQEANKLSDEPVA